MKRFIAAFFFFIALGLLFPLSANAYSNETEQSIAENAGALGLEGDYLSETEISGDESINVFEKAMLIISDALTDNRNTLLHSFGCILAVVILACVMNSMKFGSDALDTSCGYISVLALSGVAYSVLYSLFIYVIASMEALTLAISSLTPVMTSLHVVGGTLATGTASGAGLAMFLALISNICTRILLPLLRIAFALCITGALPGSVNLSSVTALVKNTATTLMAFIFSLLGFTLYLQTAIASASDSYVTRTVKFATGVFVPVIGNMLGDASRTVIASVSVVKGAVGAAGVVTVLAAVLPPLISVALHKLLLLGCAITAKTLGCEREGAFLYDLCGVLSVLLALTAGAGAVCIIALAIFIKSGVTV